MPHSIVAIDLFCGAGGLSFGLQNAGIEIAAGIDLDPACAYPFEANVGAEFVEQDVRDVKPKNLASIWRDADVRLLAGCAPCQPFSAHRRGADTRAEDRWSLLGEFGRLVAGSLPDLVTMENVPRIGSQAVFLDFVNCLEGLGYSVSWRSCSCLHFGLAQTRRRLVLVASLLGPIDVPVGEPDAEPATVRQVIESLPEIASGGVDPADDLHRSRKLSPRNDQRIKASTPGGTWEDWPKSLRAPCHRKSSGATFRNVYARMSWDEPAPTITTLAHNFGAGRFGHPTQFRPISLREAAMLQGFPRSYEFVKPGGTVYFSQLGRLIGNAVPPPVGEAVGEQLITHVADSDAAQAAMT